MGLEILEDAPETAALIASIGGGGLITGVASAIKALKPEVKVFGVEPQTNAVVGGKALRVEIKLGMSGDAAEI